MVEAELLSTLQAISSIAGAIGVCIAAIYYILNLRTTIQTRQAQLFMPIYSTYYNDEFIKAFQEVTTWNYTDYNDYMKKYSYAANPEAYMQYRKVFGYLEGLGVLVRRKLIDPSLVDDLMSGAVIITWEKLKPYILESSKRRNWPQIGEQIEYLYEKIRPIVLSQHPELDK